MNAVLVFGHPRKDSLGGALYQAFRAGLTAAGVAHRELVLADLDFNPDVHEVSPSDQWLEADIRCQSRGTPCRAAVMAANRLCAPKATASADRCPNGTGADFHHLVWGPLAGASLVNPDDFPAWLNSHWHENCCHTREEQLDKGKR
jgi:hypothetical protein